jgi:soluble lytic murein transglycosylase-like protein
VIIPIAIALGVLLMSSAKKPGPVVTIKSKSAQRLAMEAVISAAADKHKIPRAVALAFAQVESAFNPNAEGDLHWHEIDNGSRYRALVLQNAKLAHNPARLEPQAWHSYGLFQLLAPYHVLPTEHPRALLDPLVNADRGCAVIARYLKQTGGDIAAARLLFTGASKASAEKKAQIVASIDRALESQTNNDGSRIA